MYIKRDIFEWFNKLLKQYPIVSLTGPRQSGKTTFLRESLPDFEYLSLEDPDLRAFARTDPKWFLQKYAKHVIIDEAQQVPELFSYLQTHTDLSGEMGQFVLSGSQNFHLMESVTQSLAGRVALMRLLPFDMQEMRTHDILLTDWLDLIVQGHYPATYSRGIDPAVFYANYVETYLERDVSALLRAQDMIRFRQFLSICASRIGQQINLSDIANASGISQPTAKSWFAILEGSYLVFLLKPWYENQTKRIVKTPKLYFYDTGLAAFLMDIRATSDISFGAQGALFENLMVSEFHKRNFHTYSQTVFWFWRDSAGLEVDLLTKQGRAFSLFEMKSTHTIMSGLATPMLKVASELKADQVSKYLVYGGHEREERQDFTALPWVNATEW